MCDVRLSLELYFRVKKKSRCECRYNSYRNNLACMEQRECGATVMDVFSGNFISYFSVAVRRPCGQRQFKEERAYFALWFQRDRDGGKHSPGA